MVFFLFLVNLSGGGSLRPLFFFFIIASIKHTEFYTQLHGKKYFIFFLAFSFFSVGSFLSFLLLFIQPSMLRLRPLIRTSASLLRTTPACLKDLLYASSSSGKRHSALGCVLPKALSKT